MSEAPPVVVIIDDDPDIRDALQGLLETVDLQAAPFATASEFLASKRPEGPCCIVLDVRLPGLSGLDFQQELAREDIPIPIIFITGHGDIPMTVRAMKAGAAEFLTKPFRDQQLIAAIETAVAEDRKAREDRVGLADLIRLHKTLTSREHEVMALVVTGMLNKQIAFKLGTVEKTVKVHRARVMDKMGVDSIAELVRIAEKINIPPAKKH